MKFLILSDSHGRLGNLRSIFSLHSDCDAVIFCGDGASDIQRLREEHPDVQFICVRGNCDGIGGTELETLEVDGVKLAVLHGHTARAKFGDGGLIKLAHDGGYDVIIHGHTHKKRNDYISAEKPFCLFNPGAAANGDFGLAVIRHGQILLSHGSIYHDI